MQKVKWKMCYYFSLRTSGESEEVPLKHGQSYPLEVADGVNLDSDEMEADLKPQIHSKHSSSVQSVGGRSRLSSVSSAKLKYQSEIRNLIRSHQNLGDNQTDSDSDRDSNYHNKHRTINNGYDPNRYYHEELYDPVQDEPRYVEHVTVTGNCKDGYDAKNDFQVRTHNNDRANSRQNARSVIFGSNTINTQIHEEFKQRAKRNESFKMALSSPKVYRRGSMADSLRRSMEDLHDGFVSLSGKSSRTGSLRSRSGSLTSVRSLETRVRSVDTGHNTGSGHRNIQHARVYDVDDERYSSSEEDYKTEMSRESLSLPRKNDILTRSAAGLDVLSRGLGPRRSSRERMNRRKTNRSRSGSRENLGRFLLSLFVEFLRFIIVTFVLSI